MASLRPFFVVLLLVFSMWIQAKPLPIESFAQLPDASQLSLSPSGIKLASVRRFQAEDTLGVTIDVETLSSGERKTVLFTDNSKYFIDRVGWKDDKTLLVTIYYPDHRNTWMGFWRYKGDSREGRLLIVDTDTGEVTRPFSKAFLKRFKVLPSGLSNIVDTLPNDPDHILMALPPIGGGHYNVIYKINIKTQAKKTIQRSINNVFSWMTDKQHNVRLAFYREGDTTTIKVRPVGKKKLITLWQFEDFSEDVVHPMGFDFDPNILYVKAFKDGFLALFKVDIRDPDLTKELVLEAEDYDITGHLVYSPSLQKVVGLSNSEQGGTVFFDDTFNQLKTKIDKALPNTTNFLYFMTGDMSRYLVYAVSPTESGTYFLGSNNPIKLEAIDYRHKQLPPEVLSHVEHFPYNARDGLNIEGWLTLPKGKDPVKLPTVIFPHGGPHARDVRTFDYWAQFLANQGYAVLQMNFRGSDGLGIAFKNAGLQGWGKEMQDDIEDGARKLIEKGIADPSRICIVGSSYGGYAALMGIVKTPEFYQCAISVNGVSDVLQLVLDNRSYWRSYNVVDRQVGKDHSELKQVSPINYIEKIKAPVLLIHGVLDRQVDVEHSRKMHAALLGANKSSTYVELENEDHYFESERSRQKAFEAVSGFLKQHIGGR